MYGVLRIVTKVSSRFFGRCQCQVPPSKRQHQGIEVPYPAWFILLHLLFVLLSFHKGDHAFNATRRKALCKELEVSILPVLIQVEHIYTS